MANRGQIFFPSSEEEDYELESLLNENAMLRQKLEEHDLLSFELSKRALAKPRRFEPRNGERIMQRAASTAMVKNRHKRNTLNNILSVYLNYIGMQVKEYSDETCVVVFNVRLKGETVGSYALNIAKTRDKDFSTWSLRKYHLPVGFCLRAIEAKHEIMTKGYFNCMHKALLAYHDRNDQIKELKAILPAHVKLFCNTSGTSVELLLKLINRGNSEECVDVCFELHYDPFSNRPKDTDITIYGVAYPEVRKKLKDQSETLFLCTLVEAFKLTFDQQNVKNQYYVSSYLRPTINQKQILQQRNSENFCSTSEIQKQRSKSSKRNQDENHRSDKKKKKSSNDESQNENSPIVEAKKRGRPPKNKSLNDVSSSSRETSRNQSTRVSKKDKRSKIKD